jgi:hypothetical protein
MLSGNRSHYFPALSGRRRSAEPSILPGSTESRPTNPQRQLVPGSARVSRVGDDVSSSQTFFCIPFRGARAASPQLPAACRQHSTCSYIDQFSNSLGKLPRLAGWQPALPGITKKMNHCAHSSSAFGSPCKNARASPAKWREPVIKTRSLVRCAAEIASATDRVME